MYIYVKQRQRMAEQQLEQEGFDALFQAMRDQVRQQRKRKRALKEEQERARQEFMNIILAEIEENQRRKNRLTKKERQFYLDQLNAEFEKIENEQQTDTSSSSDDDLDDEEEEYKQPVIKPFQQSQYIRDWEKAMKKSSRQRLLDEQRKLIARMESEGMEPLQTQMNQDITELRRWVAHEKARLRIPLPSTIYH